MSSQFGRPGDDRIGAASVVGQMGGSVSAAQACKDIQSQRELQVEDNRTFASIDSRSRGSARPPSEARCK